MKPKKLLCAILVLSLLTLCGCGSASKDMATDAVGNGHTSAESPAEYGGLDTETGLTGVVTDRKWIITVDMSSETEDLDAFLADLSDRVQALEGYTQSSSIYNGSAYSSGSRYRSASLTIRVPAARVDEFTRQVSECSNVTSSNKDMEDITLTYVSVESRMKALQTEEARLLELMEQAQTMADLLEIEARLTDVRYELEQVTSQLRVYDDQVDYATIYLYVSEVTEYTVVREQSVWQRIAGGFTASLNGIGNFCVEAFVFVTANVLYLVLAAGAIWCALAVLRKAAQKRKTRKFQPPVEEEGK